MTERKDVNRREFISTSSVAGAAMTAAMVAGPAIKTRAQDDMLNLGIIGPGKRGKYLMNQAHRMSLEEDKWLHFVAVSDIYEEWGQQGVGVAERMAEDDVKFYTDYRELLDDERVDAVIIATPEHQHAQQLIDALAAGKDVYCEKPMVQNVKQGLEVLKAYENSDRVVQIGTQRRSVPLFADANQMVTDGMIGDVTLCKGWWYRNAADGQPGPWAYDIPGSASEDNILWEEFFYEATKEDFDLDRYFRWRGFWDYSNGIGSDLMVHQIDAICKVMGVDIPNSVVSSGGIYRWNDFRETPDTWACIMEFDKFQCAYNASFNNITRYNDKLPIQYKLDQMEGGDKAKLQEALAALDEAGMFGDKVEDYGIQMLGTRGTINVFAHHVMEVWPAPEHLWGAANELEYMRKQYGPNQPAAVDMAVRDHLANWVDCIISREKPNCTVQDGFAGAAISNMATLSYLTEKKVNWNKETMMPETS